MKLDIFFNWPPGENSARVDLGMANVEDVQKDFRVGVMPATHPGRIAWHEAGWVRGRNVEGKFQFSVKRGDKVVVEQRLSGEENADAKLVIDTDEKWPAEAHGPTHVDQGWTF